MANYYRAKQDVSIPRVVSKISGEGENAQYETEGQNYPAGAVIRASEMTPHHREQAESGKFDHVLEAVSDEDAENFGPGADEPEFGIFIAEHEAEAHALEQYGHHVIPREQELEALSASAEHVAAYQRAVKEAGLDRRHAQEAMHPNQRQRVPDHVLYGAETRTGQPHNRGAAEDQGYEGDEGEEGGDQSEQEVAARPRPSLVSEQQSEQENSGEGSDAGDQE